MKTLLGFIHSDSPYGQIAKQLKAIEDDDKRILDDLTTISSAIDAVQTSVDEGRQENRQAAVALFSGVLKRPIDRFDTEILGYERLSRPTKAQYQQHLANLRTAYEEFEDELPQSIAYKNPIAIQLCIAILAEEKAGEAAYPDAYRGDEDQIAHRLQIQIGRIELLRSMADRSEKDSIGYLLATNTTTVNALGPDFIDIDKNYLNHNLLYRTEITHGNEQNGDQICSITYRTPHMVVITKGDKGYAFTEHTLPALKHNDSCRYTVRETGHNGGGHQKTAEPPPPDHLPGASPTPDPSDAEIDWPSRVKTYQENWIKYNSAVAVVKELTPVEAALNETIAEMDMSFKTLQATCKTRRSIDCDSDTPHVLPLSLSENR